MKKKGKKGRKRRKREEGRKKRRGKKKMEEEKGREKGKKKEKREEKREEGRKIWKKKREEGEKRLEKGGKGKKKGKRKFFFRCAGNRGAVKPPHPAVPTNKIMGKKMKFFFFNFLEIVLLFRLEKAMKRCEKFFFSVARAIGGGLAPLKPPYQPTKSWVKR